MIAFTVAAIGCTAATVAAMFRRTAAATGWTVFTVPRTVAKLLACKAAERVGYIYLNPQVVIPCLYV
jgi:hypothetical protein